MISVLCGSLFGVTTLLVTPLCTQYSVTWFMALQRINKTEYKHKIIIYSNFKLKFVCGFVSDLLCSVFIIEIKNQSLPFSSWCDKKVFFFEGYCTYASSVCVCVYVVARSPTKIPLSKVMWLIYTRTVSLKYIPHWKLFTAIYTLLLHLARLSHMYGMAYCTELRENCVILGPN